MRALIHVEGRSITASAPALPGAPAHPAMTSSNDWSTVTWKRRCRIWRASLRGT
jgi:hypothetical protein